MAVSAIASNLFNLTSQLQNQQASRIRFADPNSQALASTQSSASSSFSPSSLASLLSAESLIGREFGALGAQLQAGNLAGAQQAYSTLQHDLRRDFPERHFHIHTHPRAVYSADDSSSRSTVTESHGLQGILA